MSAPLELDGWSTQKEAVSVPIELAEQTSGLLIPDSHPRELPNAPSASTQETQETFANSEHDGEFQRRPGQTILVGPREDRKVRRMLKGIHLFMITINATLGIGLYWRGGQILELGGPLAVVLSYFLVGCLVWSVMQGITEMLCIWPIPGALSVYVSKFVDEELGIAVGIAYWFTYSMSFSTLLATLAAELDYWHVFSSRGVHAGLVFTAVPVALVTVNMLKIEFYGLLEVITGSLKLLFLLVIFVFLIIINREAKTDTGAALGVEYWSRPIHYDATVAKNWPIALFMCISTAVFSFVGVEVVAASALEAKWPQHDKDGKNANSLLVGSGVKFSAIYISVLATIAYTVSGFLFIEVLSEMASVGLLIVWGCVSLAFIRYHGCTKTIIKHQEYLDQEDVAQVERNSRNYPYRSHNQPLLAWAAFIGCCTVLMVMNMASLWGEFYLLPFLSSYLTVLVFFGLWILLKVLSGGKWSFVDLSRPRRVAAILRDLHEMRAATMTDKTPEDERGDTP
ncbi:proline-specific permease [Penicillium verhagenii]|nr:proline-specific permease [Penicillium verhagenii]